MHRTLILWLPPSGDVAADTETAGADACPWWLTTGDLVLERGRGDRWRYFAAADVDAADAVRIVAVAPAIDVPVRWHDFADLTPAQAATAARITARDHVLGNAGDVHIAAGLPDHVGVAVPVASVSAAAMLGWTNWLDGHDLADVPIVPLASLIAAPAAGHVNQAAIGDETVLRSADCCAVTDAAIDILRIGPEQHVHIDEADATAMVIAGLNAPLLDLRSGDWQRARRGGLDARGRGWLLRLLAALLIVSLLIPVVQWVRLNRAAEAADARSIAVASAAGLPAATAAQAETEIDRQLASRGGGALAFSLPAAGLYAAMRDTPGVAVRNLTHRADGTLGVTLAAPRVDDINVVLKRLQAAGFTITAQAVTGNDGMQLGNVTVRALP